MTARVDPAAVAEPLHPSVSSLLATLSLEEKVGQMLMAGWPRASVGDEIAPLIREHYLGGAVLFAGSCRSPEQVRALWCDRQSLITHSWRIP